MAQLNNLGSFSPHKSIYAQFRTDTQLTITQKTVTPNYIMLRLSSTSNNWMPELDKWCLATGCGKRVNLTSISFKTEAEFAWFVMKWNPKLPETS